MAEVKICNKMTDRVDTYGGLKHSSGLLNVRNTRKSPTLMRKAWAYVIISWIALSSISYFIEGVRAAPNTDDYYALLEVPRQAQKSDIKKSYRNLSKKYHPDKNRGDEQAAEHYKLINRAYEVLGDDEKRQAFDNGGIDALEKFER